MFTGVCADIASSACPAYPGNREILSNTLVTFMCDADDPCSASTAQEPASSVTTSPCSTARPLQFCNIFPIMSVGSNWTVFPSFCVSSITSCFELLIFRTFCTTSPSRHVWSVSRAHSSAVRACSPRGCRRVANPSSKYVAHALLALCLGRKQSKSQLWVKGN